MSNKTELSEASMALQAAFDHIQKIISEHPSIMISNNGFNESAAATTEMFSKRLDFYRKQLVKIGEKMPKGKRRSKKDG